MSRNFLSLAATLGHRKPPKDTLLSVSLFAVFIASVAVGCSQNRESGPETGVDVSETGLATSKSKAHESPSNGKPPVAVSAEDDFAAAAPAPGTSSALADSATGFQTLSEEQAEVFREQLDASATFVESDTIPVNVDQPPQAAPYWPRFHDPEGTNRSPDTGLLKQWPDEGPKLVWQASGIGHGFSSVSLADGRIFTAGNLGGATTVTALDLAGGKLWQYDNGPAWNKSYEGTRGTPTADGEYVYHQSPLGELVCLKSTTGEKVWNVNVLNKFGGENIRWALAESVLIDGDRLICCPGGRDASVVALDKRTGETVWQTPSTGKPAAYASAILADISGLRMVLTMNSEALLAVNAGNGKLLFTFPHQTKYDVNATMPLVQDDHVVISSGYGTTGTKKLRILVEGKEARAEQVWHSRELDNHHGGLVLADGYIYGASHNYNGGKWICLNWNTGEMQYAERGVGKGSLTYADGMLYTYSEKRKVGLVPATPVRHDVVSDFRVDDGGGGPSWAHPVVIGGRLYLRHGDTLFCYAVE